MTRRKENFVNNNFYHLANYGIDKKIIFNDREDFLRFLSMLELFNEEETKGSSLKYKKDKGKGEKIVEIIAYALVKDHFHLILRQNKDKGIVKFMQRLSTGYAMYFNKKYKRRGALFGGRFLSEKVDSTDLLDLISYVNLNFYIHKMKVESFRLISSDVVNKRLYFTSEAEYFTKNKSLDLCNKSFVEEKMSLRKFKNYSERKIRELLEDKIYFLEI